MTPFELNIQLQQIFYNNFLNLTDPSFFFTPLIS